jgi:glycosyltransferase involved in cell wall biosynthesis
LGGGIGLRLLSVPARHPYIDAVHPAGVRPVWAERRLWEADPVFSPPVVAELGGLADLIHVHFGFDHLDADAAQRWVDALAAAGLPLVLTVHDLRNPHHPTRGRHEAVLEVLLPAAAAVTTLTPGAAAEVEHRFGRTADVLPHPTLLPDDELDPDVARDPSLVIVHLKSLRRNLQDPAAVVQAAARGARSAEGRLRVDLHPEVAEDPRLADLLGPTRTPGAEFWVHPRFSDAELERYLRRAAVTVLPHRWGTHSGWLELARDLGTRVVAPDCGYYREQWDGVFTYGNNEQAGLDEDSLAWAVEMALMEPPLEPVNWSARRAERAHVRRAHADLYRWVVDRRRSS